MLLGRQSRQIAQVMHRQGFADTYKTTPKSCSGSIYDNYLSISQYYSEEILNVRNRYNCVFANIYKILYICAMTDSTKLAPKPVGFRGSSLDDLRAFPTAAKREAGHQIDLVQNGEEPDDWKPMATTVGPGAKEIRIRDEAGAFRVIYVAKFDDAIYVLHCFQKKTEQTSKRDIDLAEKRYRDLKRELVK